MYVIVQAATYSKSDFGLHTCSHTTTQRGIVYIIPTKHICESNKNDLAQSTHACHIG